MRRHDYDTSNEGEVKMTDFGVSSKTISARVDTADAWTNGGLRPTIGLLNPYIAGLFAAGNLIIDGQFMLFIIKDMWT
jgi:hypothetical protein